MRTLDPAQLDRNGAYYLLNSVIVPRPIAWVSTLASDGVANLAPHSYTTVAGVNPPTLLFTSVGRKHTVTNIADTREFVVHVVNRQLADQMNVTAADAPDHVSEFDVAGLEQVPSDVVAPPRVAAASVAMECRLDRIVEVGIETCYVIFGEVVRFHVAERLFDERDRVDPGKLDAIARMAGAAYSTTTDRFDMTRPTYADLLQQQEGTTR